MKRTLTCLLGLAIGTALLFVHLPAQAITIGFEPVTQDVIQGDTAVVDLVIFGLGSPSLGAFDIDVTFDPLILALDTTDADSDFVIDSVVLDPTNQLDLSGWGMNPVGAGVTGGVLQFSDVSLDLESDLTFLQLDTFTLATITFNTIGLGTSSLDLTRVDLADEGGNCLQATLNSGSVNVNPIPEPTTMLLFATGLVGLVGLRRKAGK